MAPKQRNPWGKCPDCKGKGFLEIELRSEFFVNVQGKIRHDVCRQCEGVGERELDHIPQAAIPDGTVCPITERLHSHDDLVEVQHSKNHSPVTVCKHCDGVCPMQVLTGRGGEAPQPKPIYRLIWTGPRGVEASV